MAHIPPIGDAYIDEIIKAIDPYDSTLNKTQGVKLRELVKLMRDRAEQEIALSMALQHSYTEVGDTNISVSPTNYFDQPTTFIVNRNAGSDAIISFDSYAAADYTGMIYHIKNMGVIPAILVSASGALFDGEASITLSQYSAVTIMSVNLTNGGAVSTWAVMSSKEKATDDILKILTLSIIGLPGYIPVTVNGIIWPGRQKSFTVGTVLQNLVVTASGYTISPSSIPSVTIDEDKTLIFNATATGDDPVLTIVVNGLDGAYQVTVDGVNWIDNKKAFSPGSVLENIRVRVEDYDLDPIVVDQVILDSDQTLTFEATSQGFTHIDTQWEPAYGGGMQSDLSRIGNSLFNLTEGNNYIAFSAMHLFTTDISASIKCELHSGMMGVQKFGEDPGSQNRYAYAVKTESGGRVVAMSWPGRPYGSYVTLISDVAPIITEMEFTDNEVIWYYGDGVDKLEWHRVERLEFDYYLSAEVYTSIENIKQKGLTDSYHPIEPILIPNYSFLNINVENYANNDAVLLNTANVWTNIGVDSRIRSRPNRGLGVNGSLAFFYDLGLYGLEVEIKNGDNWFSGVHLRVTINQTTGVVSVLNVNVVEEILPVQPTTGQYLAISFVEETISYFRLRVSILDVNGSEVYGKNYDTTDVSLEDNYIQFNFEYQGIALSYPQGKNLIKIVNPPLNGLLDGNMFLSLISKEGVEVINTDNIWSLAENGYARVRTNKTLYVGSSVAFCYTADSIYTNLYIRVADARDSIKIEINGDGMVFVVFWDGLSEELPQQPLYGQYVQLTRVSDSAGYNDPAYFTVSIIGANGLEIWGKEYTAKYVAPGETEIEFAINNDNGKISYPQGAALISIQQGTIII